MLAFFRSCLHRLTVTKEPKKDVNACIDFINTFVNGHFLACACDIFGVTSLDDQLVLPPGIQKASNAEKSVFINRIAKMVVESCSLIEGSFTNEEVVDKGDGMYNYARVLCHYGSLVTSTLWKHSNCRLMPVLHTLPTLPIRSFGIDSSM